MGWLVVADRVRNVAAGLQGTPQIESVQPPAPEMVKGRFALWISALGNHQQLPPFPAKDTLRETRGSLNEAFVPVIGTGVREALRHCAALGRSKEAQIRFCN